MTSIELLKSQEAEIQPYVAGINAEVWQAFGELLVAQGTVPAVNIRPRYDGGQRELWFADHTHTPALAHHVYLYSRPFTGGTRDDFELASLSRVEDGTSHYDLVFTLFASRLGGHVEKLDRGVRTPNICDNEKADLITQLGEILERLDLQDPSVELRTGWKE